ncbi:MAG: patatin-like phospholipase family protein [Minicystis sp.]
MTTVPERLRILSFDGGTSAAIQVRVLRQLEHDVPGVLRRATMFAGSSDGSLVALFLALVVKDRTKTGLEILDEAIAFSNATVPALHVSLLDLTRGILGASPFLGTPPCSNVNALQKVLERYYGGATLGQLENLVVALSYDITARKPRHFFNPPDASDRSLSLVDVGLASASLPLLISLHGISIGGEAHRFLDGGTIANNPAMAAVTDAMKYLTRHPSVENGPSGERLDRIQVLSLGANEALAPQTGEPSNCLYRLALRLIDGPPPDYRWGWIQWLLNSRFNLFDLFFFSWFLGASAEVSLECQALLSDQQYFRASIEIEEVAELLVLLLFWPKDRLAARYDEIAARFCAGSVYSEMVRWAREHWMAQDSSAAGSDLAPRA